MQNSAPGVSAGLSKMPPVTMYSPVVLITIIHSTWAKDVVGPGVGRAGRSIVPSTLIRQLVTGFQRRKIIIIPFAVRRRLGSKRRSIAEEGIVRIVRGGGKSHDTQLSKFEKSFTPLLKQMPYAYEKNAEGLFVCTICKETKKNQNTMHYHMKTHEGHLPFKCQTCKKEFLHSQTLALHISARHSKNEANYVACPCCPFKSLMKSNRIVHFMRRHCEEEVKQFSKNGLTCSCEKVCNSNTAFLYHISQCIELPVEKQQLLHTLL